MNRARVAAVAAKRWAAGILIVGAVLAVLQVVTFALSLFLGIGTELAYSFFPTACIPGADIHECVWNGRALSGWSWYVWAAVALVFGLLTRNRPTGRRFIYALGTIIVVVSLMRVGIELAGYDFYVDHH